MSMGHCSTCTGGRDRARTRRYKEGRRDNELMRTFDPAPLVGKEGDCRIQSPKRFYTWPWPVCPYLHRLPQVSPPRPFTRTASRGVCACVPFFSPEYIILSSSLPFGIPPHHPHPYADNFGSRSLPHTRIFNQISCSSNCRNEHIHLHSSRPSLTCTDTCASDWDASAE
jgi:hypothetical protein